MAKLQRDFAQKDSQIAELEEALSQNTTFYSQELHEKQAQIDSLQQSNGFCKFYFLKTFSCHVDKKQVETQMAEGQRKLKETDKLRKVCRQLESQIEGYVAQFSRIRSGSRNVEADDEHLIGFSSDAIQYSKYQQEGMNIK